MFCNDIKQNVVVCTLPYNFIYRFSLSSLHCGILDLCHQTFDHAVSVNEASCTNQHTTLPPHDMNETKEHIYFNTHQW